MCSNWFSLKGSILRSALRISCVAAFCLSAVALPAAARESRNEYQDAIRQYKDGRLAEAFGRFVALANKGDADAARIAIFMHRFGPPLYGRYWDLSPHEAESWTRLIGSEKGRVELPTQTYLVPARAPKRTLNARPVKHTSGSVGVETAR